MDLWESLRVILRHRLVVSAVLCLTVAGVIAALVAVPPTYEMRTTLLLITPAQAARLTDGKTPPAVNPYLGFDGSLFIAAQVMAEAMNQDRVAAGLGLGAKPLFEVLSDPTGQSPTLTVVAKADDKAKVALTLGTVVEATRRQLSDRQQAAGAPRVSWITAQEVAPPDKPTALWSGALRTSVGLTAAGAALAVILAFGAESLTRRRESRRFEAERSQLFAASLGQGTF
jgi:hypothetical protein